VPPAFASAEQNNLLRICLESKFSATPNVSHSIKKQSIFRKYKVIQGKSLQHEVAKTRVQNNKKIWNSGLDIFSWWRQLAKGRNLNFLLLSGAVKVNALAQEALHNLPIERQTLYHWANADYWHLEEVLRTMHIRLRLTCKGIGDRDAHNCCSVYCTIKNESVVV